MRPAFLLSAAFLLAAVTTASSQTATLEVHSVTVLRNDTFHIAFDHYGLSYAPQIPSNDSPENGAAYFSPSSCCGGNGQQGIKGTPATNHLYYVPAPNFIGFDTFSVKYLRQLGNFGSQNVIKVFYLSVVPSHLDAFNDYATTTSGQSVDIDVLSNDIGNGTDLSVADIPNVNHGAAVGINNQTAVRFTPAPGFEGVASFNYTICDAQGSCDVATVSVIVRPDPSPAYDSIFILTEKNAEEVVLTEIDSSFDLVVAPLHGAIDTNGILVYVPDPGYTGYDKAVFHDAAGNRTRVALIRILDVPTPNTFLVNDVVHTAVDEPIDRIRLLANDIGGAYLTSVSVAGYPNTQEGGTLVYLPQFGKGVYGYTPPAGFEGVDRFRYKAYSPGSGYFEEAWCYVVVGNQMPVKPVFHLSTPLNTPLVLGDHLPISVYEFTNYQAGGNLGTVAFYPGAQTVTSQHGQTFSGLNMLVYDPNPDAEGVDEFEFNYCPGASGSQPCQLTKVIVRVGETPGPQCAGGDCVWSGDTNLDGVVDVRDILPIGWSMGAVGAPRNNPNTDWFGQYASNWNSLSVSGLGYDLKFVDTDGNGIVSALDTAAIRQSYGKYHNLTPVPAPAVNGLPFYIQEPDFTEVSPGDVLYAPIYLGNDTVHALDAYGLTFSIEFDPGFLEDVNIYFSDTSWMKYNAPILSMTHKPFPGKLDVGYTRTGGNSASGYGIIGVVEFIVIDDVAGTRLRSKQGKVRLAPLGMMDGGGQVLGLGGNEFTLTLRTQPTDDSQLPVASASLLVFPNPANEILTLHLNGDDVRLEQVELFHLTGARAAPPVLTDARRVQLDLSGLPTGVFLVKAVDSEGTVHSQKVQVVR